ncbi:MAG: carbon storage regulator [Gemmatimonadetes bacterium]|nr:carbon storage regulator [Gemmatimonadota bacterium]
MLILSRTAGESILIDGGIRLVIFGSDRRGVRVGIEAPAGTRILRGELVAQIAEENVRAGAVPGSVTLPDGRTLTPPPIPSVPASRV